MYPNAKAGHFQDPVSLCITDRVAAHWAQRAKKTMIESATGMVKIGLPSPPTADLMVSCSESDDSSTPLPRL